MPDLPEQVHPGLELEPITVDSSGNAYADYSREKESVIKSEALNSSNPVVRIDLETILKEAGGCGVSIVLQDFGLPPRTINIDGDFTTMSEVRDKERSDEHYTAAPKTLSLSVVSPEQNRTWFFDERGLPEDEGGRVKLSRGQAMIWAHDGFPSDQRTGYIAGDIWELVALLPEDYWGDSDFLDIEHNQMRLGSFVSYLGIAYENNILSIHSLDDVHAEVQYQQVRSLEDDLPVVLTEAIDELDLENLIVGLVAGNNEAKGKLKSMLDKHKETQATVANLSLELTQALRGNDHLETLLAGIKRKLGDARSEAARLNAKIGRLQHEAEMRGEPKNTESSDSLKDALGGNRTTKTDPYGYCRRIGLDSAFLFSLSPDAAARVVRGVHRGLAMEFHSDRQEGAPDDEPMKKVNGAVDSILQRIEQGYWGRR